MSAKPHNKPPVDWEGDDYPFILKVTLLDGVLLALTLVFIIIAIAAVFIEYGTPSVYTLMKGIHYQLSRYGLIMGAVMLAIAVYIGIIRKGDVTAWFRRGAYIIFGTMVIQAILGSIMMFGYGVQPGAPEHIIYGFGTVLTLPFFIFVEVTAKKRPSMGSYIWGFTLLIGVVIRAIGTGYIAPS